jgi:hypothetical protein
MTQSPKFAVGDEVQVVDHPQKQYIGRLAKVIIIGSGFKSHTQAIDVDLPKVEVEPRYTVQINDGELNDGAVLSILREDWLIKATETQNNRSKIQLTEFGENLATQLSGVRVGQRDYGRVANVSGHLLHFVIGDEWISLSERQQRSLISEEVPILRGIYEGYLRRGFRTIEAAQEAIKDELDRLPRRFRNSK